MTNTHKKGSRTYVAKLELFASGFEISSSTNHTSHPAPCQLTDHTRSQHHWEEKVLETYSSLPHSKPIPNAPCPHPIKLGKKSTRCITKHTQEHLDSRFDHYHSISYHDPQTSKNAINVHCQSQLGRDTGQASKQHTNQISLRNVRCGERGWALL